MFCHFKQTFSAAVNVLVFWFNLLYILNNHTRPAKSHPLMGKMTPYQIKNFLSSMFQTTSPPTPFKVCPLFCHSLSLELSGIDFHHLTPPTAPSKNHPPNTRDIFVRCFIPLPPYPHLFSTLYKVSRRSRVPLWQVERGREGVIFLLSFSQYARYKIKARKETYRGNSGGCCTF
jgi:hypothetical protein